jgi:hypothetical protein
MSSNRLHGIPMTTAPTPSADVVGWRRQRLADAGFHDDLAHALAMDPDVDLHALLSLTDRGCPPHLAARIMGSQTVADGAGIREVGDSEVGRNG